MSNNTRIPVLYRSGAGDWIMLGEGGEKFEVAMHGSPLELAMTALLNSSPSEIPIGLETVLSDWEQHDRRIDSGFAAIVIRGALKNAAPQPAPKSLLRDEKAIGSSQAAEPAAKSPSATPTIGEPRTPRQVLDWIWHMDLHLTEHDERHAGLALRAAWPHVRKYLVEVSERMAFSSPSSIATLYECPDCAFSFSRDHANDDGTYSCPVCAESKLRADNERLERELAAERTMHVSNVGYLSGKCNETSASAIVSRADVLEEAAKVVDFAAEAAKAWPERGPILRRCAQEIRALKNVCVDRTDEAKP